MQEKHTIKLKQLLDKRIARAGEIKRSGFITEQTYMQTLRRELSRIVKLKLKLLRLKRQS